MSSRFPDLDGPERDWEQDDIRLAELARRRYELMLRAHPNCRDPDHPGCDHCIDDGRDTEKEWYA